MHFKTAERPWRMVGNEIKPTDRRVHMVALEKPTGEMLLNPGPEALLEAGDLLVAIGHTEQWELPTKMACPNDVEA